MLIASSFDESSCAYIAALAQAHSSPGAGFEFVEKDCAAESKQRSHHH
jgi:hypothetical protein